MTSPAPAQITPTGCCPPFEPAPWDEREMVWQHKLFVHEHIHSFLHVPLDMGRKMKHQSELIRAAGAEPEHPIMLADEHSPWSTELYTDVTKAVPGAELETLSGTFLTKVFEGPYRDAPRWIEEMKRYVASKQRTLEKLYLGYTSCPRCAAAYGKNYVVLFAKVAA